MKSRYSVFVLAALVLVSAVAAKPPPNVVLILADDLGYECLRVNGGESYATPHLDRLAASGVRFTQAHAQTVCTPTRVQLMTGLYNVRNYVSFGQMDPASRTFANLFADAGHATAIAGKWQLGTQADLPRRFGFQTHCLWQHTRAGKDKVERYRDTLLEVDGVQRAYTDGSYGPDHTQRFVLDFIATNRARPFLVYYPMTLVHSPFDPTPESVDYGADKKTIRKRTQDAADSTEPHFVEMVSHMDRLVGELVDHLEKLRLRESTLILFMGDNGTHPDIRSRFEGRMISGGKGGTRLMDLRVPLLVSWPGTIPAGRVCDDLVDTTDVLPTLCQAAGIAAPETDGISFFPQLLGQQGTPREWTYCWYAPEDTLKAEFAADLRFKLSRSGDLFDLKSDAEEKSPLSAAESSSEAAAARAKLQAVLDRYASARPAHLPVMKAGPALKASRKKADAKAAKAKITVKAAFQPDDSTQAMQAAIDSGAARVVISKQARPWVIGPVKLRSDLELVFEPGVEVIAKKDAFAKKNARLFQGIGLKNVTLIGPGATLRMPKADYQNPALHEPGEWRHCLSFLSCENVRVEGLMLHGSGGDGIYIGCWPKDKPCSRITLRGITFDSHHRQGLSVIGVEDLLVEECTFTGTSGTAPSAGIDFEPNAENLPLRQCVIRRCTFRDNEGGALLFALQHLRSGSPPLDVRIEDCDSEGDRYALRVHGFWSDSPTGLVAVERCTFRRTGRSGVLMKNHPPGGTLFHLRDCVLDQCGLKLGGSPVVFMAEFPEITRVGGLKLQGLSLRMQTAPPPIALLGTEKSCIEGISGDIIIHSTQGRGTLSLDPATLAVIHPQPLPGTAVKVTTKP